MLWDCVIPVVTVGINVNFNVHKPTTSEISCVWRTRVANSGHVLRFEIFESKFEILGLRLYVLLLLLLLILRVAFYGNLPTD